MELIDEQLGRGIQHALKKCRKKRMGNIPFSEMFLEVWKEKRLWRLVYKKKVGQKISTRTIRRLAHTRGVHNPMSFPMTEVKFRLKEAETNYQSFVPHALTERKRFYEELASANATENNLSKEVILKRIMNVEESREHGRYMKRIFPREMTMKRVDRVTYVCEGIEKEANSPGQIVQEIQKETRDKYTSSCSTPLMEEEIHNLIGNFAQTEYAGEMRKGKISYDRFPRWTKIMLKRLETDPNIAQQNVTMDTKEIKEVWNRTKEHKASSMSNRYNAVYKSMCKDIHLLKILTHSMNLPFMLGVPYKRWSNYLDIMSFKKNNSINVNTLRTIIISEADWNAAGKIYITKRMMQNAEAQQLLPRGHIGGRKGRKATDGALTKRLALDNSRLLSRPMAIISTDAANCYDRMIHKFIAMSCIKWGVPPKVIKALLEPLHKAKHYTRTAFGDSDVYFGGDGLQGAGQGNTGAAPYWTCVSSHMINVLKDHMMNATFITPLDKKKIELALIAFVDDTELFVTVPNDNIDELIRKAERAINMWREVLEVTGGAMRPSKCAWTILAYDGKYPTKLLSMDKVQGDIHIPTEDGKIAKIDQYCPKQPRKYLGVEQQALGHEDHQLKIMEEKVEKWNQQLRKAPLLQNYNMRATLSKIQKSINYPLPTLSLTETQCDKLSNKLYSKVLPKCGVSSKFPIQFRYLPFRFQGLSLPNMYLNQELNKLQELININGNESICWDQLNLGLQSLQLDIGLQKLPYNYLYSQYAFLSKPTWILSQWKFLSEHGITIKSWEHNLPKYRSEDCYIMEAFVNKGVSKENLKTLNKCRKYLKVMTLSEISTGDVDKISQSVLGGQYIIPSLSTPYLWPNIQKPSIREWEIWKQFVRTVFCRHHNSNSLATKLGPWNNKTNANTHKWYYSRKDERLCKIISDKYMRVYKNTSTYRTSTRSRLQWFKLTSLQQYSETYLGECDIATIQESKGSNQSLVACDGWGPRSRTDSPDKTPTSTPQSLLQQLKALNIPEWAYRHLPVTLQQLKVDTAKQYMHKNMRLAVDGSYKENGSAAATIIEPLHDPKWNIIVPIRTPSNTKGIIKNDSYRAETSGILVGLYMLHAMERFTGMRTEVIVSCDNDRALEATESYNYTDSKTKHFDIIKSIIHTKKNIKSTLSFEKVLGHAEDKKPIHQLTRTELLNKECDLIAKSARVCLPAIEPKNNSHLGEGLSIWTNPTTKVYTALRETLFDEIIHAKAQSELCKKYSLTKQQFHKIDWDAVEASSSFMTQATKQWVAKFVTRFLPIGKNMVRRNHWYKDYCPRCKTQIETHDHILQCAHHQCLKTFQSSLEEIRKWMTTVETPEPLIYAIISLLTEWKLGQTIQTNRQYPVPINNQIIFGWRHFMEGRPLQEFATYMQAHYNALGSRRSGKKWTSLFIFKIWSVLYRQQWTNRNEFVHNQNVEAEATRTRENLITEVTTLYLSELQDNLLSKDQHLLEDPLNEILHGADAHLRAWTEEMKTAILDRDRVFLPTLRLQSAFLRNWMQFPQSRRPIYRRKNRRKKQRKKRVNVRPRKRPVLVSSFSSMETSIVATDTRTIQIQEESHRKVPRKKRKLNRTSL